jgi:undecaprenyl-diphosphatase
VSVIQAIVLGIVQGLTEFLPISSTGHLRIVPAFLGWEDPGAAFTAVVQLGTMAAVLLYFRKDLIRIFWAWLRSVRERTWLRSSLDARLGWFIIIGTIPIGIFGLAFSNQIETGARDLYLIGSALIVLGLILMVADRVGTKERDIEHIRTKDGIAIGLAQSLALIPGVSRSGSTITAGLFVGLDRTAAARFSFLLSVPAVVLSGLYELTKILGDGDGDHTSLGALAIATLMAFVSGYAAIAWMLKYLQNHSMAIFVVYRVVLGVVVIALAAGGAIK